MRLQRPREPDGHRVRSRSQLLLCGFMRLRGDFIGEFCETECGCGSNGTQMVSPTLGPLGHAPRATAHATTTSSASTAASRPPTCCATAPIRRCVARGRNESATCGGVPAYQLAGAADSPVLHYQRRDGWRVGPSSCAEKRLDNFQINLRAQTGALAETWPLAYGVRPWTRRNRATQTATSCCADAMPATPTNCSRGIAWQLARNG